MATEPKKKTLVDARKAQAPFEKAQKYLDARGKERHESFERAKVTGATHYEIGDAVGVATRAIPALKRASKVR